MTSKLTKEFGKVRMLELKKGLFIHEGNFEDFLKMYNLAIQRNKEDFPFRNDAGELFKIQTDYVSFVLKTLQGHDHDYLVKSANQYKKDENELTQDELKKAREELKQDFEERQKILDEKGKIYDIDGQVANKVKDPAKEARRNMLKKEIKKRQNKNK